MRRSRQRCPGKPSGGGGGGSSVIPASALYSGWANAGVVGGIPARTTIATTITSTGDTTDRLATIQSALTAAASGTTVLLGAGDFTISGRLTIPSNKTLRGNAMQGASKTRIISQYAGGVGGGIMLGNTNAGWPWATTWTAITANVARETSVITVNPAGFAVGDRVVIYQDSDEAVPVIAVQAQNGTGLARVRGFRSKITAKGVSDVTLQDPMPFALSTALSPTIALADSSAFSFQAGLEDMEVDCSGTLNADGVSLWSGDQCWLKNVKVHLAKNHGINLLNSIHCEIRGSYVDSIQNAGNNGSGILMERSCCNRIEDNILWFAFPHLEVNFASGGNVFAYNFCQNNSVIFAFGDTQGGSIDTNHGAHNSFNLYEGNCSAQFTSDGYYGSASNDVAFRNRLHGTNEEGATTNQKKDGSHCLELNRFTRNYVVVENVLGAPQSYWNTYGVTVAYENTASGVTSPCVYQLGYPNLGNVAYTGSAPPWTSSWLNVTNITNATSAFVTATNTVGIGDSIVFDHVVGMTQINRVVGSVLGPATSPVGPTPTSANFAVNIDSSAFSAYTSGGYALHNSVARWQERDTGVSSTLLRKGNYNAVDNGIPASETGGTEPASLLYGSKPSWFFSLNWPAYGTGGSTSFDVTTSFQKIPAGYRFYNSGANPP